MNLKVVENSEILFVLKLPDMGKMQVLEGLCDVSK